MSMMLEITTLDLNIQFSAFEILCLREKKREDENVSLICMRTRGGIKYGKYN